MSALAPRTGWFDARTVSGMLGLLRDVRDARNTGQCPRETFVQGMREVVGADVVVLASMSTTRLGDGYVASAITGATEDSGKTMLDFYRTARPESDPFSVAMMRSARPDPITKRRRDLIGDRVWEGSEVASVLHKQLGADDVVLSIRKTSLDSCRALVLKRGTDSAQFSESDVRVVEMLHHEFVAIDDAGNDQATKLLTRREQEVFSLLLLGDQKKLIAESLGISAHTLHDYVKAIYRKLGVSSRPELMSRFAPISRFVGR